MTGKGEKSVLEGDATDCVMESVKSMKKKHGQGCQLSDELIGFEILAKLPVKTLLRFRSVCRSWRDLVSDPAFVAAHLDRSKRTGSQLLVAAMNSDTPHNMELYSYDWRRATGFLYGLELTDYHKSMLTLCHCDGLILVATSTQMLVCNPATRESIALPEGTRNAGNWWSSNMSGFGFVTCIGSYKVVRYFYRSYDFKGHDCSMGFEVFTIGTDSAWRATSDLPPYPVYCTPLPNVVGESMYFMICSSPRSSAPSGFISFCLKDEKFKMVHLPASLDLAGDADIVIIGFKGNPCLVHWSEDRNTYDLWISKDHKNHLWIPIYSISLLEPSNFGLPIAEIHGKIMFTVAGDFVELHYCDTQSKSWGEIVRVPEDLSFFFQKNRRHFYPGRSRFRVIPYVEALVPLRRIR